MSSSVKTKRQIIVMESKIIYGDMFDLLKTAILGLVLFLYSLGVNTGVFTHVTPHRLGMNSMILICAYRRRTPRRQGHLLDTDCVR